jgi:prophage antirepressor-like protein
MEDNLLIKQFQEKNITIYGTFEKPLFKAKDIGDLLGIKNIRDTVAKFDSDFVIKINAGTTDVHFSNTWFLTIDGLYELLFISRKPIAKEFRKWVRNVLEEIRKTGEYKSNRQVECKTKNNVLIENYQNKPVLYLGMVEEKNEEQIVKYGYTSHIKDTLKRHKETYGEDFYFTYALECKEHYNLENKIQNHNDLKSRHIKKYNEKERQELLRLDKNFSVKDLISLIVNIKMDIENDRSTKLKELELEITREKTKQMQLELEILQLRQSQTQSQQQQPSASSNQVDTKKELVKKFLQLETIITTKSTDYIFLDELYEKLEEWLQSNGQTVHIPRPVFGVILSSLDEVLIKRIAIGPRVANVTPRKTAAIYRKYK